MNVKNLTNAELKEKAAAFGQVLYDSAKKQPKRKFHALYDKIYRPDILKSAWLHVKSKGGSGGVDKQTIVYIIEVVTEKKFLNDLYIKLKSKTYHPKPVKRVYIPKKNGDMRPLGIPTIEDRVVQQAVRQVIEPIFEADFQECSYGFRPKRDAKKALKEILKASAHKYWVVDIDIKGYFDNINHNKLMKLVEQRINDRSILTMIRAWLKVGVMNEGKWEKTDIGSPQGGVISPLLANIYLNYLDTIWIKHYSKVGTLVRYADDMVVIAHKKTDALKAIGILKAVFQKLELEMNLEKSRLVNIWDNTAGFDFLGYHIRKFEIWQTGGKKFYKAQAIPCKGAMKSMRRKFKDYIHPRGKLQWDTRDFIKGLNLKIDGMRRYYRQCPQGDKYLSWIDTYLRDLMVLHYNRRRGHAGFKRNRKLVYDLLKRYGLHTLRLST